MIMELHKMKQRREMVKSWGDWERFETNPFREDMVITPVRMARKAADPNRVMLHKDTREEREIHFNFYETKENEPFTKIFRESVKVLFDLSRTGMKIFWYISTQLVPNNEIAHITMKDCMEFCEFKTAKSFFDGMAELLDRGLIAKTNEKDFYYINPIIYFNGSRLRITTNFVKPKPNISTDE